MQAENREPTIADVLDELRAVRDELKDDISHVEVRLNHVEVRLTSLEADLKETGIKFAAFQKGTDGMVRMATTIIITAGTVTILSPFVQSVAPGINAFLGSNAG